ncbi:MurR/RpiR family transcriptional regulator [Tropicimonas isoalkanivorans]|uniref:Transcriptional regulator, RpiR family n=1 Tax=Tropicimonas isoalkanivorans TaxID=441112 RepID=A0A1I1MTH5_9RHOB|nr:MurR/RpiR family transcriptional regulator [Tropicimonas isoalkanivorans]SFC85893.1 transcriptional regulator, RpiR family [Tropicimonas isoalkanivorans]
MSQGFASYAKAPLDEFVGKMKKGLPGLPKQEAKVAQYFLLNLDAISFETGKSIAQKAGVAEITVGRMLRRFGCAGMKEFKAMLRHRYSVVGQAFADAEAELPADWQEQMNAELRAVRTVYGKMNTPAFQAAERYLREASEIYVTGFQTVRGLAEDTTRRLALARPRVRFLSGHDSMLSEWLDPHTEGDSCVLIIDIIPYAAESEALARLAREQGRSVIVVTDEYCHWAHDVTDAVINTPSKTGLFLESILGLNAATSLLVHSATVGTKHDVNQRMRDWRRLTNRMRLF